MLNENLIFHFKITITWNLTKQYAIGLKSAKYKNHVIEEYILTKQHATGLKSAKYENHVIKESILTK